jgi:hypothetical protein
MPVRLVRSRARPATLQYSRIGSVPGNSKDSVTSVPPSRGSSRYRQVLTMASPGPLTAKANSRPGSLAVTVQVVQ